MPPQKSKSPPQGHSVNQLAKRLKRDRRTIDKFVVDLEPVRVEGKTKFYRIEDVERAMANKGGNQSLKNQKTFEEVRKLRIKNDKDEGKLVLKTEGARVIMEVGKEIREPLEAKLVNEYPSVVAGLDVAQARVYGKRLFDQVMLIFQQFETKWNALSK